VRTDRNLHFFGTGARPPNVKFTVTSAPKTENAATWYQHVTSTDQIRSNFEWQNNLVEKLTNHLADEFRLSSLALWSNTWPLWTWHKRWL